MAYQYQSPTYHLNNGDIYDSYFCVIFTLKLAYPCASQPMKANYE